MNRNLDGTPITDEQLEALARDCGATESEIEAHQAEERMHRSWLLSITRQRRWEMLMDGQLNQDSSRTFVPKPRPTITIDPFFLNQQ
jgi:hypothetical protein